jgi:23S rRNA (uracil1939-C5)-methyltransferase/tRNA (uracil-5-)-methyltransferase
MPVPPRKFRPVPFTYHQELEATIESLSNLGAGVARVVLPDPGDSPNDPGHLQGKPAGPARRNPQGEGWVIFVPFALPRERVRIRIWRNDKNCSHADLMEILEPSPDRVDPVCPLFGTCGGCQYQHLSYGRQLEWKRDQVAALLHHMAGIDHEVLPPIPSPVAWNYRSKITPHFQKPKGGTMGPIGFLAHGTRNRIIDVPQCPIAMDAINGALPAERRRVQQSAAKFKKGATLLLRATHKGVSTNNREVVEERVGDLRFSFLAGDFFQNNPFILPAFTGYVAAQAATGCRHLVDAYCGSGLFTLSLASRFDEAIGVEVSETAADWARQNARANGIDNVTITTAPAEAIFAGITFPADDTAVVIDPPRKGCGPEFLTQLCAFLPKRLVYVSCNPATQIRDLQPLIEAGYSIEEIQPFDLFPQTRHLECVVTLAR